VKGGTLQNIRPEKVFITSQYRPNEIWEDDPAMVAAIQDRFKLVDARSWEKRRDNTNNQIWESVNKEAKGLETYEGWKLGQ